MKKALLIDTALFIVSLLGAACIQTEKVGEAFTFFTGLTFLAFPVLLIVSFGQRIKELNAKRNTPENIAARQVKKEEEAAARQEIARKQAAQRVEKQKERYDRLYAQGKIIVEVKLLGAGMTVQKGGGLGGFIVGDLVAGPLGAMVGASAKHNHHQKQRFAVKYSDGHIEIEEVTRNSARFATLMKYVKWEEVQ